jgi:hypothetical protein
MKVIAAHKCSVCEQWKGERNLEQVEDLDLFVCESCLEDHENRPGKFEGVAYDDLPFALAMYAQGPENYADHFITDEYQGAAFVIGKRIWLEDERGFVDVREFASHEAAMKELDSWEDYGFGASEQDAWINCSSYSGYEVMFESKHVGNFKTLRRAKAAVSIAMRKAGYFPNVYLTGEHGPSIRRIEVW